MYASIDTLIVRLARKPLVEVLSGGIYDKCVVGNSMVLGKIHVQRFYYFLQGRFECKASPCSH